MKNNLYFVAITSLKEFLKTHRKGEPIYFSVGRQEIGAFHGIIREKWSVCFSDLQDGICRYYQQTIGYTDKINCEPFHQEVFDKCFERAEDLREQIKEMKDFNFIQGGVSFPKDLVLHEGNEIKYDAETNKFLFLVENKKAVA